MLEQRLNKLWEQLQAKKLHMPHFLNGLRLAGLRGIQNLEVLFDYPLTVVAGGNASGKSTVLFAAACAYQVPGAGAREYSPAALFPDYNPKQGAYADTQESATLEYEYGAPHRGVSMRWQRKTRGRWRRDFFGRRGAQQPQRPVYLRTLSSLSNPAEVRGLLQLARQKNAPAETPLNAEQIDFAERMLPFEYASVTRLAANKKNLLFAEQRGGAAYSEFHMAAGERAILRLAQDIAQMKHALVLIDEVESGMHPWLQQLLMLQLQQLALPNDLQIIVTTHSPVVLDCVPRHARIFLEREESGNVKALPPHQDIIQKALYGRARNILNLLCEDSAAEGIVRGVVDKLVEDHQFHPETIRIGRDTGASEFPGHAAAFHKFGLAESFVFVLDGDQEEKGVAAKVAQKTSAIPVLFSPGKCAPELWVWRLLQRAPEDFAALLHMDAAQLKKEITRLDSVYAGAVDSEAVKAKHKLYNLTDMAEQDAESVCRGIALQQANKRSGEIRPLVRGLEDALLQWRRTR